MNEENDFENIDEENNDMIDNAKCYRKNESK